LLFVIHRMQFESVLADLRVAPAGVRARQRQPDRGKGWQTKRPLATLASRIEARGGKQNVPLPPSPCHPPRHSALQHRILFNNFNVIPGLDMV